MLIDVIRRFRLVAARSLCVSFCGLFFCALIACSPTYDWRTISNNASGYSVDMPAKPGADVRNIDVNGAPMRMHMQTAEVGGAVFVIGTLDLPDAQPATQQKALTFLRDGLARNVGAPPEARAVAVPLATGGSVPGFDMELSGKAGAKEEARTIHARFVAKGAHAYQLAIVGREQPAAEQVDQFFQSFKLY
ncbi:MULTISPECIES: hypothetical protein [unclassified Paraburkholderia]|uniref:hypothetical protein n=1 Tax=unclassified Paraburkholderia TaxID=2615204 RepID=UPI002AB17ADD|nr:MULTISPECIES: hypothetical protein [unclassified Paraburkholderia]